MSNLEESVPIFDVNKSFKEEKKNIFKKSNHLGAFFSLCEGYGSHQAKWSTEMLSKGQTLSLNGKFPKPVPTKGCLAKSTAVCVQHTGTNRALVEKHPWGSWQGCRFGRRVEKKRYEGERGNKVIPSQPFSFTASAYWGTGPGSINTTLVSYTYFLFY